MNIFLILKPVIDMKNNLRLALISPGNPYDKRSWSGTSFYLMQALEKYIGKADWISPNQPRFMKQRKTIANLRFKVSGKRSYPERTLEVSKYYAKQISGKLISKKYDLILASAASVEMAYVKTSIPIIYISDATFSLVKNIYPIFSQLSNTSLAAEEFFEQSMINKSNLLVYPSQWAAESSIRDYGADPQKINVIPFGANLNSVPDFHKATQKKIEGPVNILFLGKEWERKGGPIAVETLKELIGKGVNAKLTICGVIPPDDIKHPQIEIIPYLNKNSKDGNDRMQKILSESHVLLVPSRAECYGMVFCEANAYGIPVFAADVGGIPSIVRNGENGYLLPLKAQGREFANAIFEIVSDKKKYTSLVKNSKSRYEKVLNWDSWGRNMRITIANEFRI